MGKKQKRTRAIITDLSERKEDNAGNKKSVPVNPIATTTSLVQKGHCN
jgi:hypothetical protein